MKTIVLWPRHTPQHSKFKALKSLNSTEQEGKKKVTLTLTTTIQGSKSKSQHKRKIKVKIPVKRKVSNQKK